jgi:signal transduction histidine kinase
VGQLVASVAHEVGTPLHSIAWHVQALGEEPTVTPDMKKRIDVIDGQLTRVVRIIQDLLSSTRQRKPDPTWLPVDRVVSPVAALMEPAFQAKGVTLRVELGDAMPLVWADAEKLHQVLVNLLANAIAATSEGGTVTISAGSRPASPEEIEVGLRVGNAACTTMVTIAVSDTGSGMPEEDLQKAFTPFFTTKAIGKGTGLGLFISRETVQAHGGTLTLDSEVGKGTTVVISLPGQSSTTTPVV